MQLPFEVLSAVVVNNIVFWNVTSCNLVDSTNILEVLAASFFWVEE
jgi:hypothetical protein